MNFSASKYLIAASTTVIIFLEIGLTYSQTCSCAGPPLLGGLEFSTLIPKTLRVGLTLEYNRQDKLLSETLAYEDDARTRSTHSGMLEISYGLNERFSVTGAATVVQKTRSISYSLLLNDRLITRGFGDLVVIFKYNVINSKSVLNRQLAVGAGPKLPLGRSDLRIDEVKIAEDMQPGTGSLDWISWGNISSMLSETSKSRIYLNTTYRLTGANDAGYEYGDDFVLSAGVIYDPGDKYAVTGKAKFRWIGENTGVTGSEIPNTGGKWLFLGGVINYRLNSLLTSRFALDFPIREDINGTQLSSGFVAALSVYYDFRI